MNLNLNDKSLKIKTSNALRNKFILNEKLLSYVIFEFLKINLSLCKLNNMIMTKQILISFSLFISTLVAAHEGHEHYSSSFTTVLVASIEAPTAMAVTSDERVLVCSKGGELRVIESGKLLNTPALSLEVDNFGERGLHGILLHPDFDLNGYIYLFYSVKGENMNRLSRFTMIGNTILPATEVELFKIEGLVSKTHNGGTMKIGSDGKLYLSIGDNLKNSQQSINTLFGKIIRLNLDGSIPEDNPYYNQTTGLNRAIYAYGFRNPFSIDIHPVNGKIFVNDVGGDKFEEINELIPGGNYGWPLIEGYITDQTVPENYVDPIYAYSHADGCAIIGAIFYTPTTLTYPEELENDFIFSDFCSGGVYALNTDDNTTIDTILSIGTNSSNLALSPNGNIYIANYNDGVIKKIIYVGDGSPIITDQPKEQTFVIGEDATFKCEIYSQTDYVQKWFLNGLETNVTGNSYTIENLTFNHNLDKVYCEITNDLGTIFSDTVILKVKNNSRPQITLTEINSRATYKGGDTLSFIASIFDNEDGVINTKTARWKMDFRHDEHSHPAVPATTGLDTLTFIFPRYSEVDTNVAYDITVSVVDNDEITGTKTISVNPQLVSITITTEQDGGYFYLDGAQKSSITIRAVSGNIRDIRSPEYFFHDNQAFVFESWNNTLFNTDLSLPIPNKDTTFTLNFSYEQPYYLGKGEGLTGEIYDDVNLEGEHVATLENQDINYPFEWNGPEQLSSYEYWSGVWTGYILAPTTGEYTFTFEYDEGVRFTLGEDVLIDKLDRHTGVDSVKIDLEENTYYPVKIEYNEYQWLARLFWFWSHKYTAKEIVPKNYLYSTIVTGTDSNEIVEKTSIYPNPANDIVHIENYNPTKIDIYSQTGVLIRVENSIDSNSIDISTLDPGLYYIKMSNETSSNVQTFIKN